MTTTAIQPQAPGGVPVGTGKRDHSPEGPKGFARSQQAHIAGRFRPITTHQLLMAWWLYKAKHIGPRQLRVFFAAQEAHETRGYAKPKSDNWRPLFKIEEITRLVGEGSPADLSADIRKLGRLGLVKIEKHKISFATSIEQIAVEDISGFWTMWEHVSNQSRTVPVPRRTLRALASGFTQAQTAVVLGLIIRSIFWHKKDDCYSTSGRTKRSWLASVFGVSLRSVTEARSHLIKIGWLIPERGTPQWLLNKYGSNDTINVDWAPAKAESIPSEPEKNTDGTTVGGGVGPGESASPEGSFAPKSASPCLNRSAFSTRNLNTRRLRAGAPSPTGVSRETNLGGRKRRRARAEGPVNSGQKPNIRDIQVGDFADTERLLDLHRQATEQGLSNGSEASQLEFLAMAERARTRARKPGGMLMWLVRFKKTGNVTQAEEDRARNRLREHREQASKPKAEQRDEAQTVGDCRRTIEDLVQVHRMGRPTQPRELSEDERSVETCIRVARQHRIKDPFQVARHFKLGWTRDEWDAAFWSYRTTKVQQEQPCA